MRKTLVILIVSTTLSMNLASAYSIGNSYSIDSSYLPFTSTYHNYSYYPTHYPTTAPSDTVQAVVDNTYTVKTTTYPSYSYYPTYYPTTVISNYTPSSQISNVYGYQDTNTFYGSSHTNFNRTRTVTIECRDNNPPGLPGEYSYMVHAVPSCFSLTGEPFLIYSSQFSGVNNYRCINYYSNSNQCYIYHYDTTYKPTPTYSYN